MSNRVRGGVCHQRYNSLLFQALSVSGLLVLSSCQFLSGMLGGPSLNRKLASTPTLSISPNSVSVLEGATGAATDVQLLLELSAPASEELAIPLVIDGG